MVIPTGNGAIIETTLSIDHVGGFKIHPQDFHQLMRLKANASEEIICFTGRVRITIEELDSEE